MLPKSLRFYHDRKHLVWRGSPSEAPRFQYPDSLRANAFNVAEQVVAECRPMSASHTRGLQTFLVNVATFVPDVAAEQSFSADVKALLDEFQDRFPADLTEFNSQIASSSAYLSHNSAERP